LGLLAPLPSPAIREGGTPRHRCSDATGAGVQRAATDVFARSLRDLH